MRQNAKFQSLVSALCCLFLSVHPVLASSEVVDTPTSDNLRPLTIDDKYLLNEIPAKSSDGTLTLKGAIQVASDRNREVLESRLQVSRFKWDYIAKETGRLPNVRVISYLAQQTITQQSP